MKVFQKSFIQQKFEVDSNLLHLYSSLQDLEGRRYPEEIANRLRNFINDLSLMIFPKCPSKHDSVSDKLYYIINYEEFIPRSEREDF